MMTYIDCSGSTSISDLEYDLQTNSIIHRWYNSPDQWYALYDVPNQLFCRLAGCKSLGKAINELYEIYDVYAI